MSRARADTPHVKQLRAADLSDKSASAQLPDVHAPCPRRRRPGCVGRCGRRGFTQDISCARRWNMQDAGQEGVAMDRRTIL